MDERMDKRTNESPPVFYRTLSPSGPLPKKEGKNRRNVEEKKETKKEQKEGGNRER